LQIKEALLLPIIKENNLSTCNQSISVTHGVGMLVSALLGSGVFIHPRHCCVRSGGMVATCVVYHGIAYFADRIYFCSTREKHPHTGGTAYFFQLAFGDKAARIVRWLFIWVVALGAPVIIITGENFLVNGLNAAGVIEQSSPQILFLCALLMLFLLLVFNLFGLKAVAIIQTLLSICIGSCLVFVSLR
jgi:amino acid efflux transporter